MLDPKFALTEPLQESAFHGFSCSRKRLIFLIVLICLGLLALKTDLPGNDNGGEYNVGTRMPSVTMTWQLQVAKAQPFVDAASAPHLLQPMNRMQFRMGAAASSDNIVAGGEHVDMGTTASKTQVNRRVAFGMLGGSLAGLSELLFPAAHAASDTVKIVVVGGRGFIGSRVCKQLTKLSTKLKINIQVTAISRSSPEPPRWAVNELQEAKKRAARNEAVSNTALAWGSGEGAPSAWAQQVTWIKADALTDDYVPLLEGADAVVSCLGSYGSEQDEKINGEANVRVIDAAVKADVKRFVYVSVHPAVREAAKVVSPGYVQGKDEAERAAKAAFASNALTIVRPTTVYGGDDFIQNHWFEPRAWTESLLALDPTNVVGDLSPVDIDEIARAMALSALGLVEGGDITGHDAIVKASFALALGQIPLRKIKALGPT